MCLWYVQEAIGGQAWPQNHMEPQCPSQGQGFHGRYIPLMLQLTVHNTPTHKSTPVAPQAEQRLKLSSCKAELMQALAQQNGIAMVTTGLSLGIEAPKVSPSSVGCSFLSPPLILAHRMHRLRQLQSESS